MELKGQLHSYAPVVPSKTTPDSRPKSAKCIPVFTPKRPQNPTLWGSAYLYGLYKGVPPCPSSRVDRFLLTSPSQKLKRSWKGLQFRIPGWRPGGPVPLIFRPNGGTKGRKKFFVAPPPPPPPPPPPYLKVWIWQWSIWKTLHVDTNYYELRTKSEMPPTAPPSPVFSAIQSLSLPARSRSWSPRSCRKQERDRLVRKTTPLPERNELKPSVKETKCNFRRTSPAPISE